jgi:Mn-dependent DtxR family transcriptional regulator
MFYLDAFDRAIVHYLAKTRASRNTNQVADNLGISWNTADTHLKKLASLGYVIWEQRREGVYWKIAPF